MSLSGSSGAPAFLVLVLVLLIVVPAAAILATLTRRRYSRHRPSLQEGATAPGSSPLSIEAVIDYDRRAGIGQVSLTLRDRSVKKAGNVYRGTFPAAESDGRPEVTWTDHASPASASWWHRVAGDVPGTIQVADELFRAAQPWERILNESLTHPEADLIEWTRYVRRGVDPFPANSSTAVALDAADEWRRYLTEVYQSAPPEPAKADRSAIRVRHVIGRAVTTSAGPQIDVGGSAGLSDRSRSSAGRQEPALLDTEYLTRGKPALVVLQAEPAENPVLQAEPSESLARSVPGVVDDQPEKLALAADLMEAGTPAVLILPVVPGDRLEAIAGAIHRHVNSRRAEDARVLRHELRETLGGVGNDVLGDVVLFANVKRYSP